MGVTVQVRDLDTDVQETLRAAAAREGLSLSAFLRRELTRLAKNLEVRQRADALNQRDRLGLRRDFLAGVSSEEVVTWIHEAREENDR